MPPTLTPNNPLGGSYTGLSGIASGLQANPQAAQNVSPQAAPTPTGGNWLTHLLPTAGGILGGLGGEAVDVFGGGIGGAAAGSALGKTLENRLEGNNLGSGVASNAAEGAVGQGVGGILGRIGGKLIGAAGSGAKTLAGDLVQGQLAKGTLGKTDAQTLAQLGVTDARQIPDAAAIVTGKNGALNQAVEQSLAANGHSVNLGPIDMTPDGAEQTLKPGIVEGAKNALGQETAVSAGAGNKAVATITKAVTAIKGGAKGTEGDATSALKQSRVLRGLGSAAQETGTQTNNAEQLGIANIYNKAADDLEDRIFSPGGEAIPLTDDIKSGVIEQLSPLKDISPKAYSNVVQQVTDAKTVQDLRPIQSLWVRASQGAEKSARAIDKGSGTTASNVGGGVAAAATGFHPIAGLAALATKSPAVDRGGASLMGKLAPVLTQIGKSAVPKSVGAGAGVLSGTSNNIIQPPSNPQGTSMLGSLSPTSTTMQPSVQGAGAQSPLSADMLSYLLFNPSTLSSLVSAAQPQQQAGIAASNAAQSLQGLPTAPSGGLLSNLQGHLGLGATGEYQRQAAQAAQQIAAALPGTNAAEIQKELTDYAAGGGNIDDVKQQLLQQLQNAQGQNQGSGLLGMLGLGSQTSTLGGL